MSAAYKGDFYVIGLEDVSLRLDAAEKQATQGVQHAKKPMAKKEQEKEKEDSV